MNKIKKIINILGEIVSKILYPMWTLVVVVALFISLYRGDTLSMIFLFGVLIAYQLDKVIILLKNILEKTTTKNLIRMAYRDVITKEDISSVEQINNDCEKKP